MVGNNAATALADQSPDDVAELKAELAAANDAITDLVCDVERAKRAGYLPETGDGIPSIWWSA